MRKSVTKPRGKAKTGAVWIETEAQSRKKNSSLTNKNCTPYLSSRVTHKTEAEHLLKWLQTSPVTTEITRNQPHVVMDFFLQFDFLIEIIKRLIVVKLTIGLIKCHLIKIESEKSNCLSGIVTKFPPSNNFVPIISQLNRTLHASAK